ncbi:HDOD domain-containing protein [Luteimonas sp. R10]|uniref:HDOD domain-containing protein n=1 Tax=Luteimonas sp. R10 TaxID=3108176 RepID=UPI003087DEC8|nr:HDOD domain-containing protein [Luteimonas sp. R10]
MHILFVGDSAILPPDVIELVAAMDDTWRIDTVPDGGSATALVAETDIDAVVVASVLPDMSPATLLEQLRTLRSGCSRIALVAGGQLPSLRITGLAHRLLPLPLSAEILLEATGSLEDLCELLDNPELRSRIGRVEQLPSPPHLYLRLMHALEDDDISAQDVAQLIAGDPGIAAKVLHLCNSAFFSNGRTITDLRGAVARLGMATLRDVVLASEVFSLPAGSDIDHAQLQQRSLLASRLARRMLPESSAELGAIAALLADVGLLLPGVRNEHEPARPHDDRPGHTEAGAYLLGLWGLPMPIIEAVAFHRDPSRSSVRSFWVTGAVHVAMALASDGKIDEAYLARTNMADRLEGWRAQARVAAEAVGVAAA